MDNTKHNLYAESLTSKINRLEHTIRELTQLLQQRQNKINHLEAINKSVSNEQRELRNINSRLREKLTREKKINNNKYE